MYGGVRNVDRLDGVANIDKMLVRWIHKPVGGSPIFGVDFGDELKRLQNDPSLRYLDGEVVL
eukprot:SAG11_NODE_165_length_13834_cov_72.998544_13_plen_62_part_00